MSEREDIKGIVEFRKIQLVKESLWEVLFLYNQKF